MLTVQSTSSPFRPLGCVTLRSPRPLAARSIIACTPHCTYLRHSTIQSDCTARTAVWVSICCLECQMWLFPMSEEKESYRHICSTVQNNSKKNLKLWDG